MDVPVNNSLLALLLALKDLDTPLSEDEKAGLADVADQLYLAPDAWEEAIEPSLMQAIASNSTLQQLYQTAKSQLDALDGNIPLDLLPTRSELEKAVPAAEEVATRGFVPEVDSAEFNTHEINNMVISILGTPNPAETTKKLGAFDRVKKFLVQPIG